MTSYLMNLNAKKNFKHYFKFLNNNDNMGRLQLLEPLSVIINLAIVSFKENNTKTHHMYMNNPLWLGNASPYTNIIKVAPGQVWELDLETLNIERRNLWGNFKIDSSSINIDEFKTNLITSIKKVANTKQKTAIFLSGGLDSTCALGILKDTNITAAGCHTVVYSILLFVFVFKFFHHLFQPSFNSTMNTRVISTPVSWPNFNAL